MKGAAVAPVQRPVPPVTVMPACSPMVSLRAPGATASWQDLPLLGWAMVQVAPAGVTTPVTPGPLAVTVIGEPAKIPQAAVPVGAAN